MNRLPIILLSVICFLLSFNSSVSAQSITPTISAPLEVSSDKSQNNFLADFINSLLEKKVPETIGRVSKSQLPQSLEIKTKESAGDEAEIDSLAKKDNVDTSSVVDTASQYTVANAIGQPNKGVSSNIVDFFKQIFGGIFDIFGIIDTGDKSASEVIGSKLPQSSVSVDTDKKEQGKAMKEGVSNLKRMYLPYGVEEKSDSSE